MDSTIYQRRDMVEQAMEFLDFMGSAPADEVLYLLSPAVDEITLLPRDHLFEQGDSLHHIYILLEGEIVETRTEKARGAPRVRTLWREVKPGDLLGHFDLLYEQPYSTNARATEFCRVISINAQAVDRLLHRYPELRRRLAPMDVISRLRTIPLLGTLNVTELSYVAEVATPRNLVPGELIYSNGESVSTLYLMDHGQVRLEFADGRTHWLGNGASFGYGDQPPDRSWGVTGAVDHNAIAHCEATVFQVDYTLFRRITAMDPAERGLFLRAQREDVLANLSLLANFSQEQIRKLAGYVSHYHLPLHHVVMQQGEVADSMWVLMPGSRAALHAVNENGEGMPTVKVRGPNFFGEVALRVQLPLESTVEAEPRSQWLRLHWRDFRAFLGTERRGLEHELVMSAEAERLLQEGVTRERYRWLAPGETLVLHQRRHWVELVRKLVPAMIFLLLTVVSGLLITALTDVRWFHTLTGFFGVIGLAWGLWGYLDYLNDYLLVTNQRVVRQEKVILISEYQQVAFLEQVQNVDTSVSFWGNIFGYGLLRIQTAGAGGIIAFDYIPAPQSVKATIFDQRSQRMRHYKAGSRLVIQRLLEDRFGLRPVLPSRTHQGGDGDAELDTSFRARVRRFFFGNVTMNSLMRKEVNDRIIWRKHWFVLVVKTFAPFMLLLGAIAASIGGFAFFDVLGPFGAFLELITIPVALISLAIVAWIAADWRNDRYEVDDRQIVDIEKKPLFFSEVRRTANLGQIENIELDIPGPIHFWFNFGNVKLQTAATQGDFTFDWVPDPRGVADELRRRIDLNRRHLEERDARQRAQELPDWFETYSRLNTDIDESGYT